MGKNKAVLCMCRQGFSVVLCFMIVGRVLLELWYAYASVGCETTASSWPKLYREMTYQVPTVFCRLVASSSELEVKVLRRHYCYRLTQQVTCT